MTFIVDQWDGKGPAQRTQVADMSTELLLLLSHLPEAQAELERRGAPFGSDTAATLAAGSAESGETMPWHVEKNGGTCDGDTPWAVIKDSDGSTAGCHATEAEANDQMAALYAQEPEATAEDTEDLDLENAEMEDLTGEPDGDAEDEQSAEEALGGKPNKGTKKDKRLKQNNTGQDLVTWTDGTTRTRTWSTGPDSTVTITLSAPITYTSGTTTATTATTVLVPEEFKAKPKPSTGPMAGWKGTLIVEGTPTGDGREFAKDALTWADLPIPLQWQKESSHGGIHDVTVQVGNITAIERKAGKILGQGVFDLGSEDGREAHRRLKEGFLSGVSVVSDDITDADIELVWPETGPEETTEGDLWDVLFAQPEKVVYHAGRIRAATLVDIPAFVEASIELTDDVVAEAQEVITAAAVAVTASNLTTDTVVKLSDENTTRPPTEWFTNPNLPLPTNITVTENGRVYGHAACWGECHIGHPDMCVTPPHEDTHPYYLTGDLITADGSHVNVGQITLGTGHAPLTHDHRRAAEHYDNTGTAVADVVVGNDAHGIWVAGAVRDPDSRAARDLRAAGKVSGDWRRIGGQLRLVGLLAVNVAGFQTPQIRSRVASGVQTALVAAGIPHLGASNVEREQQAYRLLIERLAQRIDREED